jgi:rubredoxin
MDRLVAERVTCMSGPYTPFKPRRWHKRRETFDVPPAEVRKARAGSTIPKYTCGLCGLLYRYAHKGEVPSSQCPAKGPHEFMGCPAHMQFPICKIHSRSYAD